MWKTIALVAGVVVLGAAAYTGYNYWKLSSAGTFKGCCMGRSPLQILGRAPLKIL